jgi:ABC-type nickel/cobalt efflux system permease component RcnA
LLARLSGGPDHVHIGGHGHHHHHHNGAEHYHDEQGHAHPLPQPAQGWWGLIVLGISGGIVPCWDAIFMLIYAIAAQRFWLGLPLLLAFSAGLAGVLVANGIAVVKAKGFAGSHWGESRLFRTLPLVSAVLITVLGFWLAYDSLHSTHPPSHAAVSAKR